TLRQNRGRELRGEALEKGVAGGVAERVVVALEAVEVEDREQPRPVLSSILELALEIGDELPPVRQPGQRVGQRLLLAPFDQRPLVVRVGRRLVEERPVSDPDHEEPGGEKGPSAAGPPAGDREDEDDERQQEDVTDRVGEVGEHDEPAAARALVDDTYEDGG